jgi:hypothetical protein
VESGTEFAAAQGITVNGGVNLSASSGGSDTGTLFSNTTGNPVVVEFVGGAQTDGFTNAVRVAVLLKRSNGSTFADFSSNPVNLPLSFDPGIRIPDGGGVDVILVNNSGSTVSYKLDFVGREVV